MSDVPEWYPLIRASRYSNGAYTPEELAHKPVFWLNAYLTAEKAEADAQEHAAKRSQRRRRGAGRA